MGGKAESISDVKTLLKQLTLLYFLFFLHEMIDKWTSRNHEKDARNNTMSADEGGIICHTAEKIKRRSLS